MKLRVNLRTLRVFAIVLAVLLIFAAGLFLMNRWENQPVAEENLPDDTAEMQDAPEKDLVLFGGSWVAPKDHLETVLLLGLDKFEETAHGSYNNNQQSDFLLLLVLDRSAETCTAIHLNRDTMTQVRVIGAQGESAGYVEEQLALAHTYGSGGTDSCKNVAEAVSNLLYGVPIDHYISVTMDGVALLNDLAGGVTVTVLDDFSQVDAALVQGETVKLMGEQALTYVRARSGLDDSSNLRRMERQRQYLRALSEQLTARAEGDAEFLLEALLAASEYLVSDCTVEKLSALSEELGEWGVLEYLTLPGEAVRGEEFMEFYVDEQALQELVVDVFYETAE